MRIFISFLLIAILVCGCSGKAIGPITPDEPATSRIEQSSHNIWGLWQGVINPHDQTLQFVQLRAGNFHLNALTFLEPPPLVNLTLESLKFNGNIIDADIGLRHPFLGLTEFTGFDVCGIFITNGSIAGFNDPALRVAGKGDTRLLNPDGYSRWWNPAEFPHGNTMLNYKDGLLGTPDSSADYNSTINAYKYFCDDLAPNDPMGKVTLGKRGLFSAGQKNIRHYKIDMGDALIFNYAVDACWEFPQGSKPWVAPDDFGPNANRPEAWRVSITELENTLYNDGSNKGGDIKLLLDVYDWVNAGLNKVRVESPGNCPMVESATPIDGGAGYSTYEIEILDATPAQGFINLLISVESENIGYGGLLPDKTVTAYFIHPAPVSSLPLNPTVTAILPDHADQHSFVDDAVITGTNFANVKSVRLEKGTNVIEADSFAVDSPTQITADFDLMGYTYGFYDVVIEVMAGVTGKLDKGFHIILKCGTTPPALDKVYTLTPQTDSNWVCAILNAGPYKNYIIYPECNIVTQRYKVFNHMTQANNTPTTSWTAFGAYGNALCMEPANSNGLMIIQAAYSFSTWQVVNQTTGVLIQSLPHGGITGQVGDLDGNDDFWGIVNRRPDSSKPNIYTYHLQHYKYNPSTPSSPYSLSNEYDVTALFADYITPDQRWETFGDLVILPDASYCFVLTGAQGTDDFKVDKVDLTGAAPMIDTSYSFAGEGLDGESQIDMAQARTVKMELDTSDADLMPCRLVVAGTKSGGSGDIRYLNVYRFDAELKLLGKATYEYNIASGNARKFFGMALDMQNKVIVHMTQHTSTALPPAYYGYYGITKLPVDW